MSFDFTPEEREEMQCLMSEVELNPERLKALIAELVLLRKVYEYARQYRRRFPDRLQLVLRAASNQPLLERASADSRSELERLEP